MRAVGVALVALVLAAGLAAPLIAPHDPGQSFRDYLFAPPMPPRLLDGEGRLRGPFVFPLRLQNRLERRYEEDRTSPAPLGLFVRGRLIGVEDESRGPWLPLGADSSGRDLLARLLYGGRTSVGVALVAAIVALVLGALAGGASGPAVVPGDTEKSLLVAKQSAGGHPGQLGSEELQMVIDWIKNNAPEK